MGLILISGALKNLFQSVRAVRSNCNLDVLVFEESKKPRSARRKATGSEQEREAAEKLTSQPDVQPGIYADLDLNPQGTTFAFLRLNLLDYNYNRVPCDSFTIKFCLLLCPKYITVLLTFGLTRPV